MAHRRPIEDELNELRSFLTAEDLDLIGRFISSRPEERMICGNDVTLLNKVVGYTALANFLRFMDAYTVLSILDMRSTRSEAHRRIHQLRELSFQGPWLDAVEGAVSGNGDKDLETLQQLEYAEQRLNAALMLLRADLESLRNEENLLATEHGNVTDRINTVRRARAGLAVKHTFQ